MEWTRLVLDYIDTLAWPAAVVGLVAFFLIRFRESIDGLIRRIQKASGLGVQVDAPISQKPVDLGAEAGAEAKGTGEVVQDLTRKYGTKIGELTEAAEKARRETQSYATYYFYYQFERIYRLSYGTQIRLMQELDRRLNKTAPSKDLARFYDNHRAQIANIDGQLVEYDGYLNFLKQSQMIEDAGDQAIRLTTWGESFLGYIRAAALPEYKPY